MQIVHAAPEDARAVAQIHVDAWQSAYAAILPAAYLASLSVERREAMWTECIAARTPQLLVAKDDGAVNGWLSFGRCRDAEAAPTAAEVWALYVSPACWSTGIGRALWRHARQNLVAQGFASCSLWVFARNARALRFYGAAGFARDAPSLRTFELGGALVEEVRLVARLDG